MGEKGFGVHVLGIVTFSQYSLVVVQPLLTTSLAFTLLIGSAWSHRRLSSGEWFGVGCVLVGVTVFLVFAAPSETSAAAATFREWTAGLRSRARHTWHPTPRCGRSRS